MHGPEGEKRRKKRSRSRHMWSEPISAKTTTTVAAEAEAKVDSFYKDARKIKVGDCALFKPPQDSPPFIGIIRWLALNKENILQLGVNWLYRPAEVKLGKGIQLEAAPNEVFYSFHKDEIPAASLLHPCKVAFLPKGVELPSGISSFVCRRVYDIANKCLWWLTDQNYIDERQEEVDQLLDKTRKDMHASAQPGRRSPKPVNGPTTASQPKVGSDNAVKSRKRERSDQVSDHVKREHSSKTDDCGSAQFKQESILRSEISKITDKGGLVDSTGVEKFVKLLQSDRAERKMELISREILAGVIAATEKFECLNQFVQLKGLSVLDGWLQDFHKGKIGDSSSKDGDKAIEDLLLVLLRALDKLPVNLHALQMCNIGKSVNHLRSHKNLEIQKKARVLVDTWKKRVEAEMNVLDAKSGSTQASSWPSRSRLPEVSHGGNRHPGGSTDVATRSSITQLSAAKTNSIKPVQGEVTTKSASPPALNRSTSSPASAKDGHRLVVGSSSEVPSTSAREDRSSSSSQSPNHSQSRSSDHVKAPFLSRKEDARSSTAGSTGLKMYSSTSRPRSSVNGVSGHVLSASPRESGSSRTASLHRNNVSDKLSPSGLTSEKSLDVPISEGNNHKLIVKIPNRGRIPDQSASEGAVCEPCVKSSRPSSPVISEKDDRSEHNVKDKSATSDVNTESWQSNDFKDVFTASDEGDVSPSANPVKEQGEAVDVTAKLADGSKATSSSSNELRSGRVQETSFCSINALVESCAKYSEGKVPDSIGDDVGMNLLASVAAGEICDSELISPAASPNKGTLRVVDSCKGGDFKLKSSGGSSSSRDLKLLADGTVADIEKQPKEVSRDLTGHGKISTLAHEHTPVIVGSELNFSKVDLKSANPTLDANGNSDERRVSSSVAASPTSAMEKALDAAEKEQLDDKIRSLAGGASAGHIQDAKVKQRDSLTIDSKGVNEDFSSSDVEKKVECTSSHVSSQRMVQTKADVKEECNGYGPENKPHVIKVQSGEDLLHRSSSTTDLPSKNVNGPSSGDLNEIDTKSCGSCGKQNNDTGCNGYPGKGDHATAECSSVCDQKSEGMEVATGNNEIISGGATLRDSASCPVQEVEHHTRSRDSKMTCVKEEKENCTSLPADDTKPKFDLNEGFDADDGKYEYSFTPAAITVTAAAKGPFVPPEDLFRSNGQHGWKGSAATSAFRPAPRRAPESQQRVVSGSSEANAGKRSRNLLDFDLNVPDERILEDMASRNSAQETASTSDRVGNLGRNGLIGSPAVRSSGVLDFDLNRTDDTSDTGLHQTSSSRRMEVPFMPVKLPSSGGFLNSEVKRDFDLNSGPGLDDASVEPLSFQQHFRSSSMQPTPSVAGFGITNSEMGTFSSWFPSGHARPPAIMPSMLSDREHPFPVVATGGPPRIIGPHSGGTSFSADVYRGSVLSSSPAVPFPSAPFQYSIFPFGTNYSLPSATFTPGGAANHADSLAGGRMGFPIVNSQLIGPSAAVSPQFARPSVVSLSEGGNSGVAENSRTWARHGLDLNAGPGGVDVVGREENMPLSSRQLSVASSQALAEEQARMLQQMAAGGILKRKEPDGGWGTESFRYKQSSWQ